MSSHDSGMEASRKPLRGQADWTGLTRSAQVIPVGSQYELGSASSPRERLYE